MITSPDNPKLKLARRLRERRARQREGLFAAEGEDLLEAGLAAGWDPVEVLVRAGSGIEGTEVEGALLDYSSTLGSGTRVIALWPIPAVEVGEGPCVFLDGVADPGNVGTIVRSGAALAGAQVVIGSGTADPWGPKAIRASMGAVFGSPPVAAEIEHAPGPAIGIDAHDGGALDPLLRSLQPRTICLGAERAGLSDPVSSACTRLATIPLQEGAESLNVAAAAAIALHRLSSLDADHGAGPAR